MLGAECAMNVKTEGEVGCPNGLTEKSKLTVQTMAYSDSEGSTRDGGESSDAEGTCSTEGSVASLRLCDAVTSRMPIGGCKDRRRVVSKYNKLQVAVAVRGSHWEFQKVPLSPIAQSPVSRAGSPKKHSAPLLPGENTASPKKHRRPKLQFHIEPSKVRTPLVTHPASDSSVPAAARTRGSLLAVGALASTPCSNRVGAAICPWGTAGADASARTPAAHGKASTLPPPPGLPLPKKASREETLSRARKSGVPLKVRLPEAAAAFALPLDPALPAKKRPAFQECARHGPQVPLDPTMPVKKRVPSFLEEACVLQAPR